MGVLIGTRETQLRVSAKHHGATQKIVFDLGIGWLIPRTTNCTKHGISGTSKGDL